MLTSLEWRPEAPVTRERDKKRASLVRRPALLSRNGRKEVPDQEGGTDGPSKTREEKSRAFITTIKEGET